MSETADSGSRGVVLDPMVEEGPRYAEDMWLRILAILVLTSGLFCREWIATKSKEGWKRTAAWANGVKESAEPIKKDIADVIAKNPGHWVVDRQMAAGADAGDLPTVLKKAADGDVITLRPGIYDQSIEIAKSVTLAGGGRTPDEVWITSPGPQTIGVSAGRVLFKNLTISNAGDDHAWVVNATGGTLSLRNVNVRSSGFGIRAQDTAIDAADAMFDVKNALVIEGKSDSTLTRTQITSGATAIIIAGSWVTLTMERTEIQSSEGSAVEVNRFAKLRMSDVTLSRNARAAVVVNSGADVRVTRSNVTDNHGCGFLVNGGVLDVDQVNFENSQCGVGFAGPSAANIRKSVFAHLSLGPLAFKRGIGKEVVLNGGENVGLKIPERKSDEERPAKGRQK